MYAVIETGGKQYRVEVGTELEVELLDVAPGESLKFDRVLLVADGDTAAIGRPVVANASVAAEVVGRDRGEKTISFKYRPKARRRVKKGHRQELTLLRISDIVLDGHSAAADVAEAEAARKRDRARLEEAARRQAAADAELAAKLRAEKPVAEKPAPKARATATRGEASAKATAKPAGKAPKAAPAKAPATRAESKATQAAAAKAKQGGGTAPKAGPTKADAGAGTSDTRTKPAPAKRRDAGKRSTKKES
jgi:large subunit ribosomal protein L21